MKIASTTSTLLVLALAGASSAAATSSNLRGLEFNFGGLTITTPHGLDASATGQFQGGSNSETGGCSNGNCVQSSTQSIQQGSVTSFNGEQASIGGHAFGAADATTQTTGTDRTGELFLGQPHVPSTAMTASARNADTFAGVASTQFGNGDVSIITDRNAVAATTGVTNSGLMATYSNTKTIDTASGSTTGERFLNLPFFGFGLAIKLPGLKGANANVINGQQSSSSATGGAPQLPGIPMSWPLNLFIKGQWYQLTPTAQTSTSTANSGIRLNA